MRKPLSRTAVAVLALAALLITATPARAYTIYYNLPDNEADRRDDTLKHITVWVLKEPDDFGRMLRAIGHSNKNVDRWVNIGKVVAVQGVSGVVGAATGAAAAGVTGANPGAAALGIGMGYAVASVAFSAIGEAAGGPVADKISKARRDDMRAKYTLEIESINPGEYWGKIGNEKRGKVYIVITAAGANTVPIAQFWLDNTESAVITTSRTSNGQLETFIATSPANPNFPLPGDFTKAEWDAMPRDERLKIRANEEQKRKESRNAYLAWKKQQK